VFDNSDHDDMDLSGACTVGLIEKSISLAAIGLAIDPRVCKCNARNGEDSRECVIIAHHGEPTTVFVIFT